MYYIKSAESVGIKDRRATRPVLGLGQLVTQRGRSRVVEVVVEVGVRDAFRDVESSPVEDRLNVVVDKCLSRARM